MKDVKLQVRWTVKVLYGEGDEYESKVRHKGVLKGVQACVP